MRIEILESIQSLTPAKWHKLESGDFPFTKHAFLLALEQTGCLGSRTGWMPRYLTCWEDDELLGAFILYSRTNSYGEYIFDFAWAQAFESQGLNYYPKMTSAIPFTPATGSKLLVSCDCDDEMAQKICHELLTAAKNLYSENNMSSLHALLIPENELDVFSSEDFMIRHSFQYHWLNENFKYFHDFLDKLRSKRRKEIMRERNQAQGPGIKISRLTGEQLEPQHAEMMYRFYKDTVDKMGGFSYLTPDFFKTVFQTMKDQILFVLAENQDGLPVAGALNYFGESTLFGRHWGCLEDYKSLHFEICYYQGIEFAIEKKFKLFEAGAQGEHKFQRGFLPKLTYSAHQIQDKRFKEAIADFLEMEKNQIQLMLAQYDKQTPFSRAEKI